MRKNKDKKARIKNRSESKNAVKKSGRQAFLTGAADIALFTVGAAIYALSVSIFTLPNNIAPGGVTGIATVLNRLFGFPVGTTAFIINIPLFILAFRIFGKSFLSKTVVATVITSVALDIAPLIPYTYTSDKILAALYGGVLSGFGLSLVFLRGGTTGGTDIGARLINHAFSGISVGRAVLILDAAVVIMSAVAFASIESALHSVIVIFVTSKVIDTVIYGVDRGKLVYIVTGKGEKVSKAIMDELERGVTVIPSRGGYTGEQKDTLMCALRLNEVSSVRRMVQQNDPQSFMIISDASEIVGLGFKDVEGD